MPATRSISSAGKMRGEPAAIARRYTSHSHSRQRLPVSAAPRSGAVTTAP
ncbi:MAG TPA: hypothetical protein VGG16_18495 [Streptosporangiaceae bacterium]